MQSLSAMCNSKTRGGSDACHPLLLNGTPDKQGMEKKRRLSVGAVSLNAALTPPHSYTSIEKTPEQENKNQQPLSPELSSPLRPPKLKRPKISLEGSVNGSNTRSSSTNSLEELIDHLSDANKVSVLQDPAKKPPYSYAMLIGVAILQSKDGRLTLSQIYRWISSHFPYYKLCDAGWQNSIRHNLSLNEAFVKGGKSLDGKGHFWEVKSGCKSKFFKNGPSQLDSELRRKLQSASKALGAVELPIVPPAITSEPECEARLSKPKTPQGKSSNCGKAAGSYHMFRKKYRNPDTSEEYESDSDFDDRNHNDDTSLSLRHIAPSSPASLETNSTEQLAVAVQNIDRRKYADEFCFLNAEYSFQANHHGTAKADIETKIAEAANLKRAHTTAGLLNSDHLGFGACEEDITSSPLLRRYTCSFNTCIEPTSPQDKSTDSGPLMENTLPHQQDLLKTPGTHDLPSLALLRTPLVTTPRTNSASTGKLQTPFFDDFFGSPLVIKPSGTPIVCIDDCIVEDERRMEFKSPRKPTTASSTGSRGLQRSQKMLESSTISSNALFGVDVCSIWKRAVENFELDDRSFGDLQDRSKKQLDRPFKFAAKKTKK
ncbi:HHL074Cp [Eremothecium sinecaudum]|uniref:HHL074Cp n=1 Tax=Eremothecium sinecaudum TaxID=45286 RepID=A0A109UYI5_9SACH|nr:HHL074Cp [Eremothecium sinecaudum]AMD22696.1 HHL074Cp [Eremothecium sinecaudum]